MRFSEFCTPDQQTHLLPLVDYLNKAQPNHLHLWQAWTIEPILGGLNNLVYYASHPCGDFAVKFTRRDERQRASREYHTLLALQRAGLPLAPIPYALVSDRYQNLAVVQSWLEGPISDVLPASETEWHCLLAHILAVQSLAPANTAVPLPLATLPATHPRDFHTRLKQKAAELPPAARLAPVQTLLDGLGKQQYPHGAAPRLALLHGDPNLLNFVRQPGGWRAVDWENSGWGDPALEVADLMAHAAFIGVPLVTWEWFANVYAAHCGDTTAVSRIWAYYPLLLTMWVILFTRGMYDLEHDVPHDRLAPRPPDWAETLPIKYNHYLNLAFSAIE